MIGFFTAHSLLLKAGIAKLPGIFVRIIVVQQFMIICYLCRHEFV